MPRSVEYQKEIAEEIVEDFLRKLKTSINNYENKRGHSEYVRLTHVQDDCLSLYLMLDKLALLQLMQDAPELERPVGPTSKKIEPNGK